MGAQGEVDEVESDAPARRRRRTIALAVGLALIAAALVATLSRAAERRLGTNDIPVQTVFGQAFESGTLCQSGERIPTGTAAIRVTFAGSSRAAAPRLDVGLVQGEAVIARGGDARWDSGRSLVVPLQRAVPRDTEGTLCIAFGRTRPRMQWLAMGVPTVPGDGATLDGNDLQGRVHVEYLAADRASWWSLAGTVARRIELGHAWSGVSVVALLAILIIAPIALGAWQLVRGDR